MNSTIPAELLELKARFDQWRETRQYKREPIPTELRKAALEMIRRHPRALIRLALRLGQTTPPEERDEMGYAEILEARKKLDIPAVQ